MYPGPLSPTTATTFGLNILSSLCPGTLIATPLVCCWAKFLARLGRPLADDDARIHRDRAVRVGEDGVEVELSDFRVRRDELRDGQDRVAQRRDIGRGLAPHAIENRLALDVAD